MFGAKPCPLPQNALLQEYVARGDYTDCYAIDVAQTVSQARLVYAFYTTRIFRLERLILKWLVARPSTDDEARRLAQGTAASFAAWTVEKHCDNQLLMCDYTGNTRCWLMALPTGSIGEAATRLYFGSAIVARRDSVTGAKSLGVVFRVLLGFHRLYSRVLLAAAASRLARLPG